MLSGALQALALVLLAALWRAAAPSPGPLPTDAEAIASAWADAVAQDAAPPALGSRELALAVGVDGAFLESGLRAHAEGDCSEIATRRPVRPGHGFDRPEDVPAGVLCRSHGAWQQGDAAGRGDLATQAAALLQKLHASPAQCPASPLAWALSGGPGCTRGTTLSAFRLWRARKFLREVQAAGAP